MTVHEKFRRRRRWILFGFPVFFLLFAASGELYKKYNSSRVPSKSRKHKVEVC
jgi:hypothetical protein